MMEHLLLIITDTLNYISLSDAVILYSFAFMFLLLLVITVKSVESQVVCGIFCLMFLYCTGISIFGLANSCKEYQAEYINQVQTELNEDFLNGIVPKEKTEQAQLLAYEIKSMNSKGYYSIANYGHVKAKVQALAEPF